MRFWFESQRPGGHAIFVFTVITQVLYNNRLRFIDYTFGEHKTFYIIQQYVWLARHYMYNIWY